jgi:hypothetical protein
LAAVRFSFNCLKVFKKTSGVVGKFYQAKFEFSGQTRYARKAGLPDSVVEALLVGERPYFNTLGKRYIYDFCHQLMLIHHDEDDVYACARDVLGETQLVELIASIDYYTTACITLSTLDIPLTEGMEDPFSAE